MVKYMAQATINIRMDAELKEQFDLFCKQVGLSTSAAFNIFAKTVVREQRIPFEIGLRQPNVETLEAVKEVKNHKTKKANLKTYSNVDDMFEEILE